MRAGVLLLLAAAAPLAAQAPSRIEIRNVTVVDVRDGRLLSGRMVSIEGNRIAALTEGPAAAGAGAIVVDGSGKYLIPGLWDVHVHALWPFWQARFLDLLLAWGITGFRETWGSLDVAAQVRAEAARGERVIPRFIMAGNLVDGADPIWPNSTVADTPERGRVVVDSLVDAGAGFIKVYSKLEPDVYQAIASRARERGIRFGGHVPALVTAAEASRAGQWSFEHGYGLVAGCSPEASAIRDTLLAALHRAGDDTAAASAARRRAWDRAMATQDDGTCRSLFEAFKANRNWQVSTLVTMRGYTFPDSLQALGDERWEWLDAGTRSFWEATTRRVSGQPAAERELSRRWYRRDGELIRMMAAMGVPLAAGSDTPNPWAFPGSGLHDELELLVEAGLTPLQALRAATVEVGRFLDLADSVGVIAPGMLADLVLLDANPLADIRNTRRIRAVVANGILLDRKRLDGLLDRWHNRP